MRLLLLASLGGCGLAFLRTLRAVFRTALFAVGDADRIKCATHNVIANARQVFHTATAHKHKAVACRVPKDSCISTGIKSATDRQAILAALREAEVHLCGSDRLTFDLRAGKPNLILVPPRLGPAERDALRAALLGRFHTSGLSASVSVQCK